MELLPRGERIPYLEVPGIGEAEDIAGERFVHDLFLLRHKGGRRRTTHHPGEPHVLVVDIPLEPAGTYFHESYTGPVIGIHVRVYLEHETGEILLVGIYLSLDRLDGTRRRGDLHETVQQFLYPKVVQGRTEEYRGKVTGKVCFTVELRVHLRDQLQIVTQLVRQGCTKVLV